MCFLGVGSQVTIPRPHQIRCDCVECVSSSEVGNLVVIFALIFDGFDVKQDSPSVTEGGQFETLALSAQHLQGPGLPVAHRAVQRGPHPHGLQTGLGTQRAQQGGALSVTLASSLKR